MKNPSKREIKESVAKAVTALLEELNITSPSKKTKKTMDKASTLLKKELKSNLKKQARKEAKSKAPLNGKAKKKEEATPA